MSGKLQGKEAQSEGVLGDGGRAAQHVASSQ